MASLPAPSAPLSYALCVRAGGLQLKHSEVTVTVSDEGISYELDQHHGLRPFEELDMVRIQAIHGGKNNPWESMMELSFRGGASLSIYSSSPWGLNDPDRDVSYVAFAEDLHGRIAEAQRARIRFMRGTSPTRYRAMIGVAVALFVLFGGGGLFILAVAASRGNLTFGLIGTLIGIVGLFGWCVQAIRKAKPGLYDPSRLPRDIFPG